MSLCIAYKKRKTDMRTGTAEIHIHDKQHRNLNLHIPDERYSTLISNFLSHISIRMSFTIAAAPTTDIWRKPPSHNAFSAPLSHISRGELSAFRRARLTTTLPPLRDLNLYDQAGLLLAITRPGAALEEATDAQWLKTGIEVMFGEAWVSTVGCQRWADASLVPWSVLGDVGEGGPSATVEVERAEKGKAVWVYLWIPGRGGAEGRRVPVRELTWWLAGEEDEGWEISVAAYAARPLRKEGAEGEALNVEFEEFDVEWQQY